MAKRAVGLSSFVGAPTHRGALYSWSHGQEGLPRGRCRIGAPLGSITLVVGLPVMGFWWNRGNEPQGEGDALRSGCVLHCRGGCCPGGGQRGTQMRIQASVSASFPDQGERKISVLDTDYAHYMFFCVGPPLPSAEHGTVCQYLGTWLCQPGGRSAGATPH